MKFFVRSLYHHFQVIVYPVLWIKQTSNLTGKVILGLRMQTWSKLLELSDASSTLSFQNCQFSQDSPAGKGTGCLVWQPWFLRPTWWKKTVSHSMSTDHQHMCAAAWVSLTFPTYSQDKQVLNSVSLYWRKVAATLLGDKFYERKQTTCAHFLFLNF